MGNVTSAGAEAALLNRLNVYTFLDILALAVKQDRYRRNQGTLRFASQETGG